MKAKDDPISLNAEAFFTEAEDALARENPGVLDVMRVYGDAEAALRQADAYFAALNPPLRFSTSNTSG